MGEQFRLTTPVVFIFFKRMDTTQKVFEEIKKAKPEHLYLVSDGARNPEEAEKVTAVRNYVESHIDWDCEVLKNYASENMGCKDRPASGITWALEQSDQVIILEDDCIPSPDFFRFEQEMLDYYRNDQRVMLVSGYKGVQDFPIEGDYFFSCDYPIWGWGTWKRAWDLYDIKMKSWPYHRQMRTFAHIYRGKSYGPKEQEWDLVHSGGYDAWDFQWIYACLVNSGLGIISSVNLIQNIGFREDATHTITDTPEYKGELNRLSFPITIQNEVVRNFDYDEAHLRILQQKPDIMHRIINKCKRIIHEKH